MRRSALNATALATAVVALGMLPAIASGTDNGTVTGTVTAPPPAGPCIQLGTPTAIDFGTAQFGQNPPGKAGPAVTNCGSAAEKLFAAGSNATATNPSVTWSLYKNYYQGSAVVSCTLGMGLNGYQYYLSVRDSAGNGGGYMSGGGYLLLGGEQVGAPTTQDSLPAGGTWTTTHALIMPCQGSSGAGQAFHMTVTFTVTT